MEEYCRAVPVNLRIVNDLFNVSVSEFGDLFVASWMLGSKLGEIVDVFLENIEKQMVLLGITFHFNDVLKISVRFVWGQLHLLI